MGWISNFFEFLLAELADGEHVFPVGRIARVAFFTAGGAGVEEVGRRRFEVEIEAFVGVGGKEADGFILKDEIADAVENRFALIDFDAHREMRAVADEDVGAFVDRLVRELGDEVGGLFAVPPGLLAVSRVAPPNSWQ